MGSKAGFGCLWTPTRQSFAPSPWFQLFSRFNDFSKACLLFAVVSKREQTVIARGAREDGIDSVDVWKRRSAYCPCSSSFLFCDFPTPGRAWLTCCLPIHWLEFSALGGYQPSCEKAITSAFWSTAYQRGAELCSVFSLFFFSFWICSWVVQYQPQYWETA